MNYNLLYQIRAASKNFDYGATAPDPRSLCPLTSTEFVELPQTKYLAMPLGLLICDPPELHETQFVNVRI